MTFDEVTRQAAHQAEGAAALTISDMRTGHVVDEDDVTGHLLGALRTVFHLHEIDGVAFSATILRHRRGMAAEERRVGADILVHVAMETPTQTYSKGVLIQAKKSEPTDAWSRASHERLVKQCNTMLSITSAAFVFNYTNRGIRCGAATRVAGAKVVVNPNYLCRWTFYRFFLELFRCPIGDPRITSANVDDLPVPFALRIDVAGQFTIEEGASVT